MGTKLLVIKWVATASLLAILFGGVYVLFKVLMGGELDNLFWDLGRDLGEQMLSNTLGG